MAQTLVSAVSTVLSTRFAGARHPVQGQATVGSFNAHCSGNRLRRIAAQTKSPRPAPEAHAHTIGSSLPADLEAGSATGAAARAAAQDVTAGDQLDPKLTVAFVVTGPHSTHRQPTDGPFRQRSRSRIPSRRIGPDAVRRNLAGRQSANSVVGGRVWPGREWERTYFTQRSSENASVPFLPPANRRSAATSLRPAPVQLYRE